ncbi:hypothetical protein RS030_203158 [Cryptosporidium xiaoi]|uniref:Uncharacterized protein n=1 Tax=Cryptosporidium xiaoi TaxID=659607 RepID=A0AAV9XYB0_9CRYT
MRKLYIIGNILILIQVFIVLTLLNTLTIASTYAPNYREIRVVKRKLPVRPAPSRFRGELLSDGSILWYKNILTKSGNWSGWRPVSVNQVPANLVKQMAARAPKIVRIPQTSLEKERRVIRSPVGAIPEESGHGMVLLPEEQEEYEDIEEAISGIEQELPSPQFHTDTIPSTGKEYSWVELPSESSPLSLKPLGEQQKSQARTYNLQAAQVQRAPPMTKQIPSQLTKIRRVQAAGPVKQSQRPYGVYRTGEQNDMAMYFEDKQAPPLTSITGKQVPGGLFSKIAQGIKSLAPHDIPIPTIEATHKGAIPRVSEYDLTRMQWKFFASQYNPRLDNVRIIKKTPPLGLKLSKTVTECRRNMYSSFLSQYITVSGINYSKKLRRNMILLVVREIKQWCNGMMTNWYHQLQKMGYRVPTTKEFMR